MELLLAVPKNFASQMQRRRMKRKFFVANCDAIYLGYK